MARAGLRDHPKFKRLVYVLKEPIPHVWGYLECLWGTAYQLRSDVIGDDIDVELNAEFPGEPGKLVAALASCRWIDKGIDGKWVVHDLVDHCPTYVRKVLDANKENGNSGRPESGKDSEKGKSGPHIESEVKGIELENSFSRFWEAYPKKTEKRDAKARWFKMAPDQETLNAILKNIESRIASGEWRVNELQFVMNPAKYLRGERWKDQVVNGGLNGRNGGMGPSRVGVTEEAKVVAAERAAKSQTFLDSLPDDPAPTELAS